MAIEVLHRGRRGRIYVKDERDDGVEILLVCTEADAEDGKTGIVAAQGTALAGTPDPHAGSFPMGLGEPAFELTLDTSGLSSGVRTFRIGEFVARAAELSERGAGTVRLDAEVAAGFGYVRQDEQLVQMTGA